MTTDGGTAGRLPYHGYGMLEVLMKFDTLPYVGFAGNSGHPHLCSC